jgi:hypothetical protein
LEEAGFSGFSGADGREHIGTLMDEGRATMLDSVGGQEGAERLLEEEKATVKRLGELRNTEIPNQRRKFEEARYPAQMAEKTIQETGTRRDEQQESYEQALLAMTQNPDLSKAIFELCTKGGSIYDIQVSREGLRVAQEAVQNNRTRQQEIEDRLAELAKSNPSFWQFAEKKRQQAEQTRLEQELYGTDSEPGLEQALTGLQGAVEKEVEAALKADRALQEQLTPLHDLVQAGRERVNEVRTTNKQEGRPERRFTTDGILRDAFGRVNNSLDRRVDDQKPALETLRAEEQRLRDLERELAEATATKDKQQAVLRALPRY